MFRFSATAFAADRIADFDACEDDFMKLADFVAGFGCAALDTKNDDRLGECEPDRNVGGGVENELAGVASLGATAHFFIA